MRKAFFRSRFRQILLLILLPVLLFAILSSAITYARVRTEARNKSLMVTDLIAQNMETLSGDLDFYRISIDYDPQMNVALINSLLNKTPTYRDSESLRKAMHYLNSSANARAYLHSIYVTMKGSEYLITEGSRMEIAGFADRSWKEAVESQTQPRWFEVRGIRTHVLNEAGTDVVTVFQRMKYRQVLIINIRRSYFDKWLDSITDYDGQALMILDENNQVLFGNQNAAALPPELVAEVLGQLPDTDGDVAVAGDKGPAGDVPQNGPESPRGQETVGGYYINIGGGDPFGLRYLSLIPEREVLRLPSQIIWVAVLVMAVSVILASLLAAFMTSRDYGQIKQIIDVFEQAEKGEPAGEIKASRNTPYFYIINNIINLFLSQSYLTVQLEARKYALMAAQLSALQYQLNPHFLFNTLQAIDLEILKTGRGPTAANTMVNHLSELLRYSLEDPLKKVTIEREIEMTRHYVALQKQKKGRQFEVTWEYEPEVLRFKTLRLLLQPLIENALAHGVVEGRKLWIKVKICAREGQITFYVMDNGAGIDKAELARIRADLQTVYELRTQEEYPEAGIGGEGRHIGLKNIAKRVTLGYAQGDVVLRSKPGMGTVIGVRISQELKTTDDDTFL